MSKIKIDDIAAAGPELNEGDLRLVNGGAKFDRTSWVIVIGMGEYPDRDDMSDA
ncbi:hypothetical protein [Nonomuraea sp. CA-141351]|uniref:hypothetical protein n=1 Tax=Nonomuraea sp. CA-141351 TaxID=3239996 RepID=UPI003D90F9CB